MKESSLMIIEKAKVDCTCLMGILSMEIFKITNYKEIRLFIKRLNRESSKDIGKIIN